MNDDLNDALSKAFDQVEGSNEQPVAEVGAESAPEPIGDGQAEDGGAASAERTRDDQGRFAKAEAKPEKRETLTLKGKQNAQEKQQGQGQETPPAGMVEQPAAEPARQSSAPIPPPAHWLGAAKKHWDRLPAEVRDHIHRDGEQVAQTHGLTQALAPYAQVLTSEFGGADRGIAAILGTWQFARTQPVDFARQFLQNRGIDPRVLAGEAPSQAQPSGEPADPVLAPVLQRMQQLEAAVQHFQQQPLIAQQNQIQTEVESFGAAVNQDGSVAHPYFNDVKPIMASLMGSGTAKTLKEAYDMAVYANPAIRADLMATEQAKQAEQRRRAAEAAKGAAASIAGSPGHSGPGKAQNETVDATLERAWERAVSGARA